MKVGDYVWLEVQDRKENENLGGHTERPLLVIDRTASTFVIEHGDVVERGNIDRFGWANAPTTEAPLINEKLEATTVDLAINTVMERVCW